MTMGTTIGWDLGGANLKLARLESGRVTLVAQIPCPVIPDRSKFNCALSEALNSLPTRRGRQPRRHHDGRAVGCVRHP